MYTAVQAADGLAAYLTNCASCHLPDLEGRNEAPQLAGVNFMNAWGSRTTSELIRYIQATRISWPSFSRRTAPRLETAGSRSQDRSASIPRPMDKCPRPYVKC